MSKIKMFVNSRPEISNLTHYWENDHRVVLKRKNDDGFDISIEDDGEFIFIKTDNGYHEERKIKSYDSYEKALAHACGLVRDLLSKNMRIRVFSKNETPIKWILEYFEDSNWHEESIKKVATKENLLNLFTKRTEKIYLNDILPPRELGSESETH